MTSRNESAYSHRQTRAISVSISSTRQTDHTEGFPSGKHLDGHISPVEPSDAITLYSTASTNISINDYAASSFEHQALNHRTDHEFGIDEPMDTDDYGFNVEFATDQTWSRDRSWQSRHHQTVPSQGSSDAPESEELSVAFLPKSPPWRSPKSIAFVGGIALTTTAGFVYTPPSQPQFAGTIQIAPEQTENEAGVELISFSPTSIAAPESSLTIPESSPHPSFSITQQTQHLETQIIPQALAHLKSQGLTLTQTDLLKNIELQQHASGIVEISYQASQADDVNQVLGAIANFYQESTRTCRSQACLNADYIQAQIPHVEQAIHQSKANLVAFRDQHQLADIAQQQRVLTAKVRQFSRIQNELDMELSDAQTQLSEYDRQLGLDPENSSQAHALLEHAPNYRWLLEQWIELDRQLVNELTTPLTNPARTNLMQEYEQLSGQLYEGIHFMVRSMDIYEMNSELWDAILEHPQRADLVEAWLNQAQLVQLLSIRKNHLSAIAQQLDTETQQWRSHITQYRQLESDLRQAEQTLANYKERYANLNQQLSPEQVVWHLIKPPEVTQTAVSPLRSIKNRFAKYLERPAHAYPLNSDHG